MNKNKMARLELEMLFTAKCMLTEMSENLTYHHIQKKSKKGKETTDNGALLTGLVHEWLHNDIEQCDKETYHLINECLKLYKQCILENQSELVEQYETEVIPEVQKILSKQNKMLVA